ncbi:MAG: dephospho-CoA kinase [Saprospiraceae bacterium]|nr:dephospho-CoA kinase [Saprospiraceae bacterium]MBP9194143.1 dephospho-CoA kinase [Saprospiraceae bacterium]
MIKVGITGGIGSGKSTVCSIFEMLGVPVYYADDRAKKIMTANKQVKKAIIDVFSKQAYFSNGRINRKFISEIIFQQPEKRNLLNAIVHPAVLEDGRQWNLAQNSAITLKEAALLIQSGSYKEMDYVILVECPLDVRIPRVMKRNKLSKQEVLNRIQSQMSDEEMRKFADFRIQNDGKISLIQQVLKIYRSLLEGK